MTRQSAGLVLFRRTGREGVLEVLLGHMGGPLWAKKDLNAWSIPKGELEPGEDPRAAALREFSEELGLPAPGGELVDLGTARQSAKVVHAWAVEHDVDPQDVRPGTFTMVWPPRSGRLTTFPELDRVAWFTLQDAAPRIVAGQRVFLDRLHGRLAP